jgi:predicted DNA-binding transcriptional regulator AlpA
VPEAQKRQPRWIRNADLARYLGVSSMCLWRWVRDPELGFPQPTVIGRYSYTDLDQVNAWMRSRVVDFAAGARKKQAAR